MTVASAIVPLETDPVSSTRQLNLPVRGRQPHIAMPRLLILLTVVALVFAYFKFFANASRAQRKQRLQWVGYGLAAAGLTWGVVRTGALSAGVLGAMALALLRAIPALLAWKRRMGTGPTTEAPGDTNPRRGDSAPRRGGMSRSEALQVLELTGEPSPEQVMQRYRELMRHLHPDRGGSNYLAAKLNEARRVLLAE